MMFNVLRFHYAGGHLKIAAAPRRTYAGYPGSPASERLSGLCEAACNAAQ